MDTSVDLSKTDIKHDQSPSEKSCDESDAIKAKKQDEERKENAKRRFNEIADNVDVAMQKNSLLE